MYSVKKVKKWNIKELKSVADILYECGRDMKEKYGLEHWNNSRIKTAVIVALCALKNDIFIVHDGERAVATFQTKVKDAALTFQKLATRPSASGNGIGSFCLNRIEELASEKGCLTVKCEVYDKSEHAMRFYEKRGYIVCGSAETLKYKEYKLEKRLEKLEENIGAKQKTVLIVGAGFLQSFVIKKAKSMGYRTLAVDLNPEAEGFRYADGHAVINIVDEKACLEYARREKIDGVLTAATDYGVLTAAYIAKEMGLRGLDYEVAKLIKNKYRVRKCLYENAVDDTKEAYEVSEDTDLASLIECVSFPVMVKPCDGSGSRGASRVDKKEDFAEACRFAMSASLTHRATVETFIFGKEYGAETLVVDGEPHVFAIMRKWMTEPPYYAELGHAIPTDLSPEVEARAIACVEKAVRALGVNSGSVNMDMLITVEGNVHIIDVGARMGGNMIGSHIIPYGTGIDYMANMIRYAVGDEVDFTPATKSAVATRLLAFGGGVVNTLPDFDGIEREFDVEIYHHMTAGQKVNEYHTNLDGCGYIVAKGVDIEVCIINAENAKRVIGKSITR